MQSAAHRKWIFAPSLKLALAALGVAAVLFGIAAYLTFQDDEDSAAGSTHDTAVRLPLSEANPRFLEMNELPDASTSSVAPSQAPQSLQHVRFLEMNRLPEARVLVPDYRFLEMNVLPGDDVASDAPIQTGQPR